MQGIKNLQSFAGRLWVKLIGSRAQYTSGNRVVNAVLVISIGFLFFTALTNLIAQLKEPFYINCILLVLIFAIYYLSRIRRAYQLSFIAYAICSYVALAMTFLYNAGSTGPSIFLFFLTFQLLVAISPKRQVLLWVILHALAGFSLMYMEFKNPLLIQGYYDSAQTRFLDNTITYIICLFFVYFITTYLRKKYEREKCVAQARAEEIAKRHAQLKKIAELQSHEIRNHVATISGLAELIDTSEIKNEDNKVALEGIKYASIHLDIVIREINDLTITGDKKE